MSAPARAEFFQAAARQYARRGWALVPTRGKIAGPGWNKARPEDEGLAAGKWSRWGVDRNLAIVAGPSQLAIVDVDGTEGEALLAELLDGSEVPETPSVRTRRGRHLYFRDPGGLSPHAGGGLDLRAGSSYVVAPPSDHDKGRYAWIVAPWEVEVAEMPEALVEHFRASRNGAAPVVGEIIPIGTIDETLASLAGSMRRRGMSEDAIYAALVAELPRCEPGHTHTEKDCRRIAKSVAQYTPTTPSRDPVPTPSRVDPVPRPGFLVGTGTDDPVPDPAPAISSWAPIDLVALAASPPAPPEIIDLFYPGSNHLVSGESEALKTWLMQAAGSRELEAGHGVLWVDGDDVGPGALLERLRLLGADDAAISERFAYVRPDERIDAHLEGVLDLVRARRIRLAVFDGFNPLLALHGLDPNVGVDVEAFYKLIAPIKRLGAANVITDNVVKSREARGGWAIGSERKRSKAEVHLEMRPLTPLVRGGTGRAKLTVRKDRHGHLTRPSPGILVIESGAVFSWRVDPDDSRDEQGSFRPTELMAKVSRFLEHHFDEPQSRTQIEEGTTGKTEYVRKAIDALIEEGFAEEHEGKRGARLVHLVRPFSDEAGE